MKSLHVPPTQWWPKLFYISHTFFRIFTQTFLVQNFLRWGRDIESPTDFEGNTDGKLLKITKSFGHGWVGGTIKLFENSQLSLTRTHLQYV